MDGRQLLGPADVDDTELTRIVASALGTDPDATELLTVEVSAVDYDVPAITTAARYWVSGEAQVGDRRLPWRVFVKHVQSWARSPLFAFVPPELQEVAAASVPWRTEGLAYRSDLGDLLPDDLRMPRALAVHDLDELSCAVWLEEIAVVDVAWDLDRYGRAAHLLGQLAGSEAVAARRNVGGSDFTIRENYLGGRLRGQVLPMLHDDRVWQHPLVSGAFDDELRGRLLAVADRAEELVTELERHPLLSAHGDACPNNLLVPAEGDGFVLIDYGFWGPNPLGFDLGQLLVGEVQMGRQDASALPAVEERIVPAYHHGLLGMGVDVAEDDVRRAHALQLVIFCGLSTLPFEHLDQEPTDALHAVAAERATTARFSLDLLDATA